MEKDTIFSDGGGVQSVTILALIKRGFLPKPEIIFHAVMGIPELYLKPYRDAVIMPMIREIGSLYVESNKDFYGALQKRIITPFWYLGKDGTADLSTRRSCTLDYKVNPSNKQIPRRAWNTTWLGISLDEERRVRDTAYLTHGRVRENWYPLIALGLTRKACVELLEDFGIPMPEKSSCDMCPFSSKIRLVERLSKDAGLYERIKFIEACWHKNPKNKDRYLTQYLEKLPTQEEAKVLYKSLLGIRDDSGTCGVCEF